MITSPLPVLLVVIFGIVIGCKCSYKKFHYYLNPSISTMFKSRMEHLNGGGGFVDAILQYLHCPVWLLPHTQQVP